MQELDETPFTSAADVQLGLCAGLLTTGAVAASDSDSAACLGSLSPARLPCLASVEEDTLRDAATLCASIIGTHGEGRIPFSEEKRE